MTSCIFPFTSPHGAQNGLSVQVMESCCEVESYAYCTVNPEREAEPRSDVSENPPAAAFAWRHAHWAGVTVKT
jgi:hypothetical protein